MEKDQLATLLVVLAAIGGAIYYLEGTKPGRGGSGLVTEITAQDMPTEEKSRKFPAAKEIVTPSGFINTEPLHLKDLVGQQVILVDFWTYSCINCQRTLPHLNAWQEKYGDQGLTIVGVHTPEFAFEQEQENVQAAVDSFGITYPVVLDNDYATWQAYSNRYWPRKYLIDIDGYIVYDHIGEGAYAETEQKIQELLRERAERLNTADIRTSPPESPLPPDARADVGSPEIYFGSSRNEYLANGEQRPAGPQQLAMPSTVVTNQLYLTGAWDITPEYAQPTAAPAAIFFRYQAKNVYMVAAADTPTTVEVLQDGHLVNTITIHADRLYTLIENTAPGEHTLEVRLPAPGLRAYTFTFG